MRLSALGIQEALIYIPRQDMIGRPAADPLDTLYRRFGPAIHRRVRAMLRDEDEAFDVTQDTFLAYMRGSSALRGEASPFTVLYQIATFKAVDRMRRNSRWSGVLGPLEVQADTDSSHPGTWADSHEGGLARVEALRDLALLTDGESPQALTAAVLYFVEGHTMQEVGQVLGLDRKAISELLHAFAERARNRSTRFRAGETS